MVTANDFFRQALNDGSLESSTLKQSLIPELQNEKLMYETTINQCLSKACGMKGCSDAQTWQKAYSRMFGKRAECAMIIYKLGFEHLKDTFPYPIHSRCYDINDVSSLITQKNPSYGKIQEHVASVQASSRSDSKIPKDFNSVWLTTSKRNETRTEEVFNQSAPYIFDNVEATQNWNSHTLWVNNATIIPQAIKNRCADAVVNLKTLDDLVITNERHKKLVSYVKEMSEKKMFGTAGDVARGLIEYYKGGVYMDGDQKLFEVGVLENHMKERSSLLAFYNSQFAIHESFMAMAAGRTFMATALDSIYNSIYNVSQTENFFQYSCVEPFIHTRSTSPRLLYGAVMSGDEEDVFLPYCSVLFRKSLSACKDSPIPLISIDEGAHTWREENLLEGALSWFNYEAKGDLEIVEKLAAVNNELVLAGAEL